MPKSRIDVVGLGLNATDTVIIVREFPALGGKERVVSVSRQAGGQVATALVTCRRLGLRARYIGKVGDDEGGRYQLASLKREGLDVRFTSMARNTPNQLAYIIVDQATGERTVFWDRDRRLAVRASELTPQILKGANVLHLDGCDVEACTLAARWARQAGIPVVADLDTVYKKVERLFPYIDYLVASANFLPAVTGNNDPFRVLEFMAREYGIRAPGMTLGRDGALVYWQGKFCYSPGFVVETLDTTGAGDIFHGAFIYGLVQGWEMHRILDFSNAMAGLNCTKLGARGGIASRAEAERLVERGSRHVNPAYAPGPKSGRRTRAPRPPAGASRRS
ncbi:MAG TPA: PfkB family carbohydrate kinase [Terriglobia bacterium]|nr:PfkB family carbohydrate kinase [Terriglobia bacterium]